MVSELLNLLPQWVKPGDTILAYPDLPTVHYLTRTTTWTQNPWPILQRGPTLTAQLSSDSISPAAFCSSPPRPSSSSGATTMS